MAELLSQQEIDNLLAGISSGSVDVSQQEQKEPMPKSNKEILAFDFRLPHRLSKNQLRTLQAVHENFAESLSSYLISRLQTTVNISVASIDQLFYSEYVLSIGNPSCLYVFKIVESDALAVLELNPQLVLSFVSRLLGGPVGEEKKARLLTQIEQTIIKGIVQKAISNLQKSWKTIAPLTFQIERYETEGEFVQVAPTSEIVLLVSLQVIIGDQKFMMSICFPTFALEDELSKLNMQTFASGIPLSNMRKNNSEQMLKRISQTKVPVTAVFGHATLSVKELLELQVSDVIKTNISVNSNVEIEIGGATRFLGKPGVVNGHVAIQVHSSASNH
jgi:flagellar motor switch protein FliM